MSTIKDNKYIWIAFWMWLSFLTPAKAASGEIDVQDIVFSHIQDAYTWHITEWNGQEIAIPLPILVKSEERGWDLFLSSHLHHGHFHQSDKSARRLVRVLFIPMGGPENDEKQEAATEEQSANILGQ